MDASLAKQVNRSTRRVLGSILQALPRPREVRAHFIRDDILAEESSLIRKLPGTVDIMVAGDFLHLFSWDAQLEAAARMVRLSKAQQGTVIIGKQIGRRPAEAVVNQWTAKDAMYLHDENTFQRMWADVAEKTGTKRAVRVKMVEFGDTGFWGPKEDFAWMSPRNVGIQFVLTRQEGNDPSAQKAEARSAL